MLEEFSYVCESCGEDIVVPLDVSQGQSQQYSEDCPVCCRPHLITIYRHENGEVDVRSELEQQ